MKKTSVTIEKRSKCLVVSSEVESICKALSSGRVIEVKICDMRGGECLPFGSWSSELFRIAMSIPGLRVCYPHVNPTLILHNTANDSEIPRLKLPNGLICRLDMQLQVRLPELLFPIVQYLKGALPALS
jgi:hypothetical protein